MGEKVGQQSPSGKAWESQLSHVWTTGNELFGERKHGLELI